MKTPEQELEEICEEKNIDINNLFRRTNIARMHWLWISKHKNLSEEFMEEYKKKLDWVYISGDQDLSESFMEKHKDRLNWFFISKYQNLSDSFIIKYINKLDVNEILKREDLNLSRNTIQILKKLGKNPKQELEEICARFGFERKKLSKENWKIISSFRFLSPAFIRRYRFKLDFYEISKHQELGAKLQKELAAFVNWNVYIDNQEPRTNFDETFIEENLETIGVNNIFKTQQLSEEFIRKHYKEITFDKNLSIDSEWGMECLRLSFVVQKQQVSEEFIEESISIIKSYKNDWYTPQLPEMYPLEIYLTNVARFQNISDNFILKYIDKMKNAIQLKSSVKILLERKDLKLEKNTRIFLEMLDV